MRPVPAWKELFKAFRAGPVILLLAGPGLQKNKIEGDYFESHGLYNYKGLVTLLFGPLVARAYVLPTPG